MMRTVRSDLTTRLLVALASAASLTTIQDADSLPSWTDGPAKRSITALVEKVSGVGSPDFVPLAERIVTFDNDGTLWAEQPT
jgi:hypothetical protein